MKTMTTMTTALALAVAVAGGVLLAACDGATSDSLPNTGKTTGGPATAPAPTAPPPRTMVDGTVLPTSPLNLIMDPSFGLVDDGEAGFGAFLAFADSDESQLTIATGFDSRAPTGFAAAYGIVQSPNATNTKSDGVLMLTSFQGGAGPFDAQVWVSKSDIAGNPVDFTITKDTLTVSVTDSSPDGTAFDLTGIDADTKVVGARSWVHLRVEVPQTLEYGGYFVAHTGNGGGAWLFAAPEVLAQPIVNGTATRSLALGASASKAVGRPRTRAERAAMAAYASRKPRLVPAKAKRDPRL